MIMMAAAKKYEWNLYRLVAIPDQILRKVYHGNADRLLGLRS